MESTTDTIQLWIWTENLLNKDFYIEMEKNIDIWMKNIYPENVQIDHVTIIFKLPFNIVFQKDKWIQHLF